MSNKNSSEKLYEKLNETITSLINCWNPNHSSDFDKEYYEKLKNKIFDLYIPKNNLIIEVDGCYWHSKNVKLDDMDEQQLRRWKNDRYKDNLANKKGYKLMRIWEDEIDVTNVLERIYNV